VVLQARGSLGKLTPRESLDMCELRRLFRSCLLTLLTRVPDQQL
jgi:hypothetical protein